MHRPKRIAEALREEITEIVSYELEDPRIQSISVTKVVVSDNLRDASVYVLVEGTEEEILKTMQVLRNAERFVRRQLALSMNMRRVPYIHFIRDTVEERAMKVERLIDELSSKG
ncbi:MAG: 30S ribosome-binding factor RbfA [Pyrinomonadaceae bacterium]|nr:30S ribosome-binding factor RbfA [Pyrinomonadaceae bacterium]MCX7639218.1 30S ribosome-binding factor RbfA [Pyrinomonadaceae bacterium]MDW8303560.1 30S ribosome-binding factor RbfA [Acidobacteriota bacterium]